MLCLRGKRVCSIKWYSFLSNKNKYSKEKLKGDIEKSKWDNLLSLWMLYIEHIAEINEMDVNDFDIESEVRSMFLKADQEHIWILASLVLDSLDSQILALKATHTEEICSIIESNIQSKLNAIRTFRQSNE